MKFLYKQYPAKKKEIIEVTIDQPVKLKFMTAHEFAQYKQGKTHRFFGGLFEESPVRFVIPFDSVWYVIVEKGTHYRPIEVNANSRLLTPDRQVRSSIASDTPDHVRAAIEGGNGASHVNEEAMNEGEGRDQA